jgi:hypothetical protein
MAALPACAQATEWDALLTAAFGMDRDNIGVLRRRRTGLTATQG